jgi:hypothetical protein
MDSGFRSDELKRSNSNLAWRCFILLSEVDFFWV